MSDTWIVKVRRNSKDYIVRNSQLEGGSDNPDLIEIEYIGETVENILYFSGVTKIVIEATNE